MTVDSIGRAKICIGYLRLRVGQAFARTRHAFTSGLGTVVGSPEAPSRLGRQLSDAIEAVVNTTFR
jgi:hypothetical protein